MWYALVGLLWLMSGGLAHAQGSAIISSFSGIFWHDTDCRNNTPQAVLDQLCGDRNTNATWRCANPTITGSTTNCESTAEWVRNLGTIAPTDTTPNYQPADPDLTTLAGKTPQGTGSDVRLSTGPFTNGNCVETDANGNLVDAGAACGTGSGGSSTLDQAFDLGNIIDGATASRKFTVGDGSTKKEMWAASGVWNEQVTPAQDLVTVLNTGFTQRWRKDDGTTDLFTLSEAGTLTGTSSLTTNFGSAAATMPVKVGTSDPGGCTVGQLLFRSNAVAGANLKGCTSTGTWTTLTGGGGGLSDIPVPLILTPDTDGSDTLTLQTAAGANRVQMGTLVSDTTKGALYLGNVTPSATNYSLMGDTTNTQLAAPVAHFFNTAGAVRMHIDSNGVTLNGPFKLPYVGGADVGFGRLSAGVMEVTNTTSGQNAPLVLGLRDASSTGLGTGLTLRRQLSTGTAAAGFGASLLYQLNSSTTANNDAGRMDVLWTDATHATRTAKLDINLTNSGTMTKVGTWTPAGLQIGAGGYVELPDISTPASPSAGFSRVYKKTSGTLCEKNSAGVETCLGATVLNTSNASAPGSGDDNTVGYSVGSHWIETTSNPDVIYEATDVSTSAAVWRIITDTDTDNQTTQDVFDQGKTISNANSFANAWKVGVDDGDGDYSDSGESGRAFWSDVNGANERVIPDANDITNIPSGFAKVWQYNGTEAMRITSTTLTYATSHRPTKSVEVEGIEFGSCVYTTETVASGKPKNTVFTCTDSDSDGFHWKFRAPKNWNAGTLKVQATAYSTHASPSGNVVLSCSANAVGDGEVIPDTNTTNEQTVTLGLATQYKEETAESAAITVNSSPAAGDTIYGHCDIDATGTTANAMSNVRIMSTVKVYYTVTQITE